MNEEEICSRMIEGKEMGFKVVKVTMSQDTFGRRGIDQP